MGFGQLLTPTTAGQPVPQAQGGEIQGKNVEPTGTPNAGSIVTPNGTVTTPAANALVAQNSSNSGKVR